MTRMTKFATILALAVSSAGLVGGAQAFTQSDSFNFGDNNLFLFLNLNDRRSNFSPVSPS